VQDFRNVRAVRDLAEIGQASKPKGFIGMVYADGNSVGRLIEELLETPDHYAEFAQALFDANKTAVFEALAENLHTSKIERKKVKQIRVHPFEILGIGGDDVLLILPAHAALKIACAIAAKVEAHLPQYHLKGDEPGAGGYTWERVQRCRGVSPAHQCAVSMSVGVVLADAHTPVFYLEELASQLLKSAKRRAKWLRRNYNYCGGTVDFLSLKSTTMISSTIEQFRSQAFSRSHGRLYARPYTIAEMEALLDSIRALKASGFPRNQLYRLRESLGVSKEQSTVDYLYFLSRDDRTRSAREMIEKKWSPTESRLPHPWRVQLEDKDQRETIWHDLVELYDFVATKEEEHGEGKD
jgi:CRISPR-associated protein Cmr2